MRLARDIVAEVRQAADTGAREVQLLGQIVNHYQAPDDSGCDFAELLARINDVPGIERIRFASPHPRHVTPRMMQAMRDLPKVCRHLHLPVQSGSTRILQAMRRRHTREEYLDLLAGAARGHAGHRAFDRYDRRLPGRDGGRLRRHDVADPGRPLSQHVFLQSTRRGPTRSPSSGCLTTCRRRRRRGASWRCSRSSGRSRGNCSQASVGRVEPVLVDATSRRREWELSGRTSGNTVVNFPGDPAWVGQVVDVTITARTPTACAESLAGQGAKG